MIICCKKIEREPGSLNFLANGNGGLGQQEREGSGKSESYLGRKRLVLSRTLLFSIQKSTSIAQQVTQRCARAGQHAGRPGPARARSKPTGPVQARSKPTGPLSTMWAADLSLLRNFISDPQAECFFLSQPKNSKIQKNNTKYRPAGGTSPTRRPRPSRCKNLNFLSPTRPVPLFPHHRLSS